MLKYLPDLSCTLQPSTLHHSFQTASQWSISLPFLAELTYPACATSVLPNDHSWSPSPAQHLLWKVCWNQQQQKSPSPLKNPGLSHTAEHQPKGCHISVPGFQEASVMLCPRFADGLCLETHGIYCAYTGHLSSVQTKGPWLLEMLDTSHVLQSKSGHCRKCI